MAYLQKRLLGAARHFSTTTRTNSKAFSSVISEELASKSPQLATLHRRLQLPGSFKLATLARALTCAKADRKYPSNYGMSIFGKNMLSYYATEHFLVKHPRLPLPVLNAAVDSVVGDAALHRTGQSWGIEVDRDSELDKYLHAVPEEHAVGRLRFDPQHTELERSLTAVGGGEAGRYQQTEQRAMAAAVKAIVGGVYALTKSSAATKRFVESYIVGASQVRVQDMFEFEQPTRELAVLCRREGLAAPVSRLLSETGRVSKRPVFLVGVFSGHDKLGESFGASLREAQVRAAVAALKNWYLYTPVAPSAPSDEHHAPAAVDVDHGAVVV